MSIVIENKDFLKRDTLCDNKNLNTEVFSIIGLALNVQKIVI